MLLDEISPFLPHACKIELAKVNVRVKHVIDSVYPALGVEAPRLSKQA